MARTELTPFDDSNDVVSTIVNNCENNNDLVTNGRGNDQEGKAAADTECQQHVVEIMVKRSFSSSSTSDSNNLLNLSNQNLKDEDLLDPSYLQLSCAERAIHHLDASRNLLGHFPAKILTSVSISQHLQILNLSRNSLKSMPQDLSALKYLKKLLLLSNNLRLQPLLESLTSLLSQNTSFELLDVRYNRKLNKLSAHHAIEQVLAQSKKEATLHCCTKQQETAGNDLKKESACDRDATLLKSQLEPLSTPQLRKRLQRTFGLELDKCSTDIEKTFDRSWVMNTLLEEYKKFGPRTIRQEHGWPLISKERQQELLGILESLQWKTKERPTINAQRYIILQMENTGQFNSKRTQIEKAKRQKYAAILKAALETLHEADPTYHPTAIAVTKNFIGSPHIDTLNTAPFYALSLGNFQEGEGQIAVECSATVVAHVTTHNRIAKVDGRFPHWVTPYDNQDGVVTRYSLIYYKTSGDIVSQTTAIFRPPSTADEKEWTPPLSFVI